MMDTREKDEEDEQQQKNMTKKSVHEICTPVL